MAAEGGVWARSSVTRGPPGGRGGVSHYWLFINSHSRYRPTMDLEANLKAVQERIEAACARAGRPPNSVTLVAVTKSQPPEAVCAAAAFGLTLFGENKVQEAKAKIPACPGRLRWHMVGHLQTNKCRDAVELFEMVQSVDSLHLAEALNLRAEQAAKRLPVLLEVNAVGEASKFGYRPDQLLADLDRHQCAAAPGNPRADDRAAVGAESGEGAAGVPSNARTEGALRATPGRAAAAPEHGNDGRFRGRHRGRRDDGAHWHGAVWGAKTGSGLRGLRVHLGNTTISGSHRPETRRPKSEGRKKAEVRNPKGEPAPSPRLGLRPTRQRLNQRWQMGESRLCGLRASDFGLLSAFGFRI